MAPASARSRRCRCRNLHPTQKPKAREASNFAGDRLKHFDGRSDTLAPRDRCPTECPVRGCPAHPATLAARVGGAGPRTNMLFAANQNLQRRPSKSMIRRPCRRISRQGSCEGSPQRVSAIAAASYRAADRHRLSGSRGRSDPLRFISGPASPREVFPSAPSHRRSAPFATATPHGPTAARAYFPNGSPRRRPSPFCLFRWPARSRASARTMRGPASREPDPPSRRVPQESLRESSPARFPRFDRRRGRLVRSDESGGLLWTPCDSPLDSRLPRTTRGPRSLSGFSPVCTV